VTISSTEGIGVAAFTRSGYLWVVVDQADFSVEPQISGLSKETPKPKWGKIALTGATAFRAELPKMPHMYGEGGGLVWKIIGTPSARNAKPVEMERRDGGDKGASLFWPAKSVRRVIDIPDPMAGDTIKAIIVGSSADFGGEEKRFVELDALPSVIGLALAPKVDDLAAEKDSEGVALSRPQGMAISPEADIPSAVADLGKPPSETGAEVDAEEADAEPLSTIYKFDKWEMGGPSARIENQRVVLSALSEKEKDMQAADLLTLAKMEVANGFGAEALGFVNFAEDLIPEIESNPEFLAIRGAAAALAGKSDAAFRDFSRPELEPYSEIKYWKAFALAGLEDWKQAEQILPKDVSLIGQYPQNIRGALGIALSEVFLRAGNTEDADRLIEMLSADEQNMPLSYKAALEYLRGESFRQQGHADSTKELWGNLVKGPDDLYRAKAGLALAVLEQEKGEIKPEESIDRLEGLRYAWRGDGLEVSINHRLGRAYVDSGEPIKGLTLLRQAASLSPASEQGKQIAAYMTDTFRDLFMTDRLVSLTPIDALTLYDEFSELVPSGEDGDKLARRLAERLVEADLLPRAANLLQEQIDTRLKGIDGANVAARLASIQLLDGKPDKAIETLGRAELFIATDTTPEATAKKREISLLRARAYSDQKKPEEAVSSLALLDQDPDVLRLRADIAWKAKNWQDVADALEELTTKQDISLTRPLTDDQADTILNWAVALYLADNRYVLANLRERFSDAMTQTAKAKQFEVVTRPRQNILLADRKTINSIVSEIDIFKGFMDTFGEKDMPKGEDKKPDTTSPAPAKPVAGEDKNKP
jgi:hypothetical protein